MVLLALPLLGSSQPSQAILGITATPEPTVAVSGSSDNGVVASSPLDRPGRPDPAGARSAPAARLAPSPASLTGYQWPLHNARLTLPFGPSPWGSRIVRGALFHDAIDVASFCGDRVVAAHDGVVLAAGRHYDEFMGWIGDLTPYTARLDEKGLWITLPIVVAIDDGNGYRSVYAHFGRVVVKPGEVVSAGDLLGYEGATGRASGCHLHYELFSLDEQATMGMEPTAAAHMLLPTTMVARIDPQLVLPPMASAGIH